MRAVAGAAPRVQSRSLGWLAPERCGRAMADDHRFDATRLGYRSGLGQRWAAFAGRRAPS